MAVAMIRRRCTLRRMNSDLTFLRTDGTSWKQLPRYDHIYGEIGLSFLPTLQIAFSRLVIALKAENKVGYKLIMLPMCN